MTAFGTPDHGAGASLPQQGAWNYPYVGQPIVAPQELAPVGPPRYFAPERSVRDPRRTTLAAVLTFVTMLIGCWALLSFLGSMSSTLSSMAASNEKLKAQLGQASDGLADLDVKTQRIAGMSTSAAELRTVLGEIDTNMGTMLAGVTTIGTEMESMRGSLGTLDDELGTVNTANTGLARDLSKINTDLKQQVTNVGRMRGDIVATEQVVASLPGRLAATNGRLGHINSVVNQMGCAGIVSSINVDVQFTFMPAGNAAIKATIVPPGSWGTKQDGSPC